MIYYEAVLSLIQKERQRQIAKYGDPELTNEERLQILMSEVGELTDEVNNFTFEDRFPDVYKSNKENLKKELIQVAAVAVAWLEKL